MPNVLHKISDPGDGSPDVMFFCPGCKCGHGVWTTHNNKHTGAKWDWNGSLEKPTFSPSILVQRKLWDPPVTPENCEQFRANPWPQKQIDFVCHSFVKDGMIQFLGDCTHGLKGQTVPLQPF